MDARDNVTIDSAQFDSYWRAFTLQWSVFLILDMLNEFADALTPEWDPRQFQHWAQKIADVGKVPIITPEELNL